MPDDPNAEDFDLTLLTRYLTGELSPAEMRAAELWLDTDPRHRAALDELRAVWEATSGEVRGWDTQKGVAQLRSRVLQSDALSSSGSHARDRRIGGPFSTPRRHSWLAAAAAIAAVLAGVALLRQEPRAVVTPPVASAPTEIEIRTMPGEQKELELPDGSHVILAAATTLRYDSDFGVRDRTLDLDGEAYVEAAHAGAAPLRIRAARGVAEDIGTAFVVRAYGADAMQVVVTEGAVVLRSDIDAPSSVDTPSRSDSLVLNARQLGRVLPNGDLEFTERVDPADYLAWTKGQLAFTDVPLQEVARELSRWYNADVRVADTRVAQRRFTGSFERGALADAVHLIAAVADVSIRRSDAAWIFH